ncbi:MAG: ECF-type sigma factor [Gemmatimonadota bacterium]
MNEQLDRLIQDADRGDVAAAEALFTSLYRELHELAERHLRKSSPELTLGTTTLVHEAYLTVAGRSSASFPDRARFFAYASRAMRGLIIDYLRQRRAKKRGGEFQITQVSDDVVASAGPPETDLGLLGDALEELRALDGSLAELVDLHFFGGFSFVEIAALRGVSDRTIQRDWRKARLVLHRTLNGSEVARSGSINLESLLPEA